MSKRATPLTALAVLALLLVACDGTHSMNRNKVLYSRCYARLKSISAAITDYRRDHNDEYPADLSAMSPKYIEQNALLCPLMSAPFTYHVPTNDPASDIVLVRSASDQYISPESGERGHLVLMSNGSIRLEARRP